MLRVTEEIGEGHEAGEHEGDKSCLETHEQQRAAGDFNDARRAEQRHKLHAGEHLHMWNAEEFGGSMRDKQEREDDPQKPKHMRRETHGDNR
jgi:hypothetical protein